MHESTIAIEWYSEANGRVVLELDPEQVEIVGGEVEAKEKTAEEAVGDDRRRAKAMVGFLESMRHVPIRGVVGRDAATPKPE